MKNGRPRPTFSRAQRYTRRVTDQVQPPDDRTYSAEVTSFPSNLLHHRSVRIAFPIARMYDTTPLPHCQALFQRNSRNTPPVLGQNRDLAICAVGWYFWYIFHATMKQWYKRSIVDNQVIPLWWNHLVLFAPLQPADAGHLPHLANAKQERLKRLPCPARDGGAVSAAD